MTAESSKKIISEMIWMEYFNKTLFDRGVITEDEKNKMKLKIDAHFKEKQK